MRRALLALVVALIPAAASAYDPNDYLKPPVTAPDPDYPSYLTPPSEWQNPAPPPPGIPWYMWETPPYPSPQTAPWKREEPDLASRQECYALLTGRQQWMARYKYFLYQNTQARGGHLYHQEVDRIERVVFKKYYYMEMDFRRFAILGDLENCKRMDREVKEFANGVLWETVRKRLD